MELSRIGAWLGPLSLRSAAETPVVVPCFASTVTVIAVPMREVFCPTIMGMSSSVRRLPVVGAQI